MIEVRDRAEESVYRILERCGGKANRATLQVSVQAMEALDRLIERGQIRECGILSSAVELVPEAVRETYIEQSRPQDLPVTIRSSKSYREGRRQHYSPLKGRFTDRIRQLAARILHWIGIWGDQDEEGRPRCDKRALERALHANRLPDWKPAIEYLVKCNGIAISGQTVTVLDHPTCARDLPDPHDPDGRKAAKELKEANRRSRPKRPLSEWVKNKIRERGGEISLGR